MPPRKQSALQDLARIIARGLSPGDAVPRDLLAGLFGQRYGKRDLKEGMIRDTYGGRSSDGDAQGVPFAGLINPDSPPSGPYGGCSLVWFPTLEAGSLLTFVVGTLGLSPDEGILSRPGHRRRLTGLAALGCTRSHGLVQV